MCSASWLHAYSSALQIINPESYLPIRKSLWEVSGDWQKDMTFMLYIWYVQFWINTKKKNDGEVGQIIGAKGDVDPVLTSVMFSIYILEMNKLNSQVYFSFCDTLKFF